MLQSKVIKISRDPNGGHCIWYVTKLLDRPGWETSAHYPPLPLVIRSEKGHKVHLA
jgi:hypothetical protein